MSRDPAVQTVLLFGATGSAGGAVLDACLADAGVAEVRVLARRPLERHDAKLRVTMHQDFADYRAVGDTFTGVDACLFCLGLSVRQVSGESQYRGITKDFALAAARMLIARSPDASFEYLSGQGASATSRMMWARVKAEAEQALRDTAGANAWRPGFIDGATSASAPALYQWVRPAFRLLLASSRTLYVRGDDIGRAMLLASRRSLRGQTFENRDIRVLADEYRREPGGHRRP